MFRILRSAAEVRAAFPTAILLSVYPWFWAVTGGDTVVLRIAYDNSEDRPSSSTIVDVTVHLLAPAK